MTKRTKVVIILGMHRTGTSMTSGVLSKLGVNMGEQPLVKAKSNLFGQFEDSSFRDLNNQILGMSGGNWKSPPKREIIYALEDKFTGKIRELVESKQSKIWGWKDPRTSLTIKLYLPHLANPYFLVCHREIQAIAKSLKCAYPRLEIKIEEGRKLAKIYEERINVFFNNHPKLQRLHISYETITNNPGKWVQKIINFLKIQPSEKEYQKAINFILPNEEIQRLKKV